ncbi:MAG: DUF6391 domain-containing protein [Chloroflexota bacterium]|nr:DUF6391 domain-containing protein [Chloroflexota bacterium]
MSLKDWLLELPGVGKVRRVHALEHATITLLSRRHRNLSMIGRSTPKGFWLYGDVDKEELESTANEALGRLQGGEASLAIHPRCGTNLAVAGMLTGVSSFLASLSIHKDERTIDKLPRVVLAATAAMLIAQPAGLAVQEGYTTCPDASNLSIGKIRQSTRGKVTVSFVEVNG